MGMMAGSLRLDILPGPHGRDHQQPPAGDCNWPGIATGRGLQLEGRRHETLAREQPARLGVRLGQVATAGAGNSRRR